MNLRYEVLKAVSKNPGATANDIADAIDHDGHKVRWAITDCRKGGLLSVRRDDMTNQPGYTLTDAGKKRLEEGPASKQGRNQHAGTEDIPAPQYDPDDVAFTKVAAPDGSPDAQAEEFTLLGVIAEIRAAVGDPTGKIMLGDLAQHIGETFKLNEGHRQDVMAWEREIEKVLDVGSPTEAAAEITGLKADNAILREAVEQMQREQMRGATCLSGQDRYEAAGYLVRAPKRKPRVVTKEETARAAALAAAKATGRADVLALVPVGRAVRGSEWRPA